MKIYAQRARPFLGACLIAIALGYPASARAAPWPEAAPLLTRYDDPAGHLIEFRVDQPERYFPGARILFFLRGEPRAKASVQIEAEGVDRTLILRETEPGFYEGSHVARSGEDFERARFTAELIKRRDVSFAIASAAPRRHSDRWTEPAPVCLSCGKVESVQLIEPLPGEYRPLARAEHLLTIQMDDGRAQRFVFPERPRFNPGQRVRVEGGRVFAD